MFIRQCYPKLLETALAIVDNSKSPHLVILGNPGIGKTYFGYVLLLHLARSNATVVYQSGKEGQRYLFSADGVFKGNMDDFSLYLDEASTFYIADGCKPVDVQAKTILLSSVRRDVWYKFSDDHCAIRYMPVWSQDEIELCRKALFDDLLPDEVESLYLKWGGIPRYVLANAREPEQQSRLDYAISAVDLDLLAKAIGNYEASDPTTHPLIHLTVADDFRSNRRYLFASEYVADQVYLQLYRSKRNDLMDFLVVSQGVGDMGVLRVRELLDPTAPSTALELPALQSPCRPRISNYESVDPFEKPGVLLQITCAETHPCKQAGIRKVLDLLGDPINPVSYFVVPNDRFSNFKYQKYESAKGEQMQEPTFANVKQVKQFVLTIDLTTRTQYTCSFSLNPAYH
eukprot:jgi/Hompol1/2166/HPOL_005862-RA